MKRLRILSCIAVLVLLQAETVHSNAQTRIYWTETRPSTAPFQAGPAFVMRADADGSNPVEVVSGGANIKGPNGLEYGGGFLYWPDQQLGSVQRVKPDGSELSKFFPSANPYDVFIGTDRTYITSQTGNSVDSCKGDGTDVLRVLDRTKTTSPFAVEVTDANIYWSEVSGSGRIRRSDLAGENIVTLVPNVFSYDFQISGGFLYIGDNNYPAAIKRANLDGTGLVKLLAVDFVNGIWLTKDSIYWSDLQSLHRCTLAGGNPATIYTAPIGAQVRGIVVLEDQAASVSPQLGSPRAVGTNLVFTLQAAAGKTVQIEKAAALSSSGWSSIATLVGSGNPISITNPINRAASSQFFRARSE